MSFSIGIVGLPNVGKSTLFKALTEKQVAIAPRPFTTIEPNIARVAVPDKRLAEISRLINPEKITPVSVEFIDIAGLVRGAHEGQGLGNQFLSNIQPCRAVLEVVRIFEADEIEHTEKNIDPERDIEVIDTEFLMKDLKIIQSQLENLEKKCRGGSKEELELLLILQKIEIAAKKGIKISQLDLTETEKALIKDFQFLSQKPIIYLFNIQSGQREKAETQVRDFMGEKRFFIADLKLEEEMTELSTEEKREFGATSLLDRVIAECYNVLDLITFYTIAGGKECRAWPGQKDITAQEAAGKVHSDFEEKFIKAEILPGEELIRHGSWQTAKEKGLIKTAGRDYIVQDGEIIEFKI